MHTNSYMYQSEFCAELQVEISLKKAKVYIRALGNRVVSNSKARGNSPNIKFYYKASVQLLSGKKFRVCKLGLSAQREPFQVVSMEVHNLVQAWSNVSPD